MRFWRDLLMWGWCCQHATSRCARLVCLVDDLTGCHIRPICDWHNRLMTWQDDE